MLNGESYRPPKSGNLLLSCSIGLLFFIIVVSLWYFQIYKGQEFAQKAKANIIRKRSVYALRGLIRDRWGTILAENKPAYGLAIIREDCPNIDQVIAQVSQWTGISKTSLKVKFNKDKKQVKPFEPQLLVPNLDFQTVAKIESNLLYWPGLQILSRPMRFYPYEQMTAHILGYVAQANKKELRKNSELQLGDRVGKQGVELAFEKWLRGTKGLKQLEVNAKGRKLREKIIEKPKPGTDIQLALDLSLQKFIWNHFDQKAGAVIVMEPESGEILSLISKPSYDNNLFVRGIKADKWNQLLSDKRHPLQNRVIQSSYPPGSVFKLVMASCALNKKKFDPQEEKYCPGHYRLGRRIFKCWKVVGHGWMDLREAIKQSCDVYFYKLGHDLGVNSISNFAQGYGFNQKTGISLPNEISGLIPDRRWKLKRFGQKWQGGETLNMSIGQGYTLVTPIQVACFVGALINGGKFVRPKLVLDGQTVIQNKLPITDQDRNKIIKAMIAAVEEPHGTCWRLRTKGATIGGKTGTAQVVKLKEGDRDKELEEIPYKYRDHGWMASFGQKGSQTYVVVALVEHGGHGSTAAGPIVKDIYQYLFSR